MGYCKSQLRFSSELGELIRNLLKSRNGVKEHIGYQPLTVNLTFLRIDFLKSFLMKCFKSLSFSNRINWIGFKRHLCFKCTRLQVLPHFIAYRSWWSKLGKQRFLNLDKIFRVNFTQSVSHNLFTASSFHQSLLPVLIFQIWN